MYRLCRSFLIVVLISLIALPVQAADAPPSDQADVTVVVTAERTLQPVSESISSATVITAKQIREQGAQSVADVMKLAPGVAVTQNGQTGSLANAHVRGTSSSQALVLIDGQRLTSSAFGGTADLSKIPVTDIARIEVIRGPVSSLYGSDAIGGVINIITKESLGSKGEAKLGFGSVARQTKYMTLGGGDERSTWQVTTDFPAYSGARANSDYSATDLSGKLSFMDIGGWDLSLRGNDYQDSLGLPGATNYLSTDNHQWWNRRSFDLSAKRNIGSGQIEVSGYTSDQRLKNLDPDPNPDYSTDSLITGKTASAEVVYRLPRGNQNWVFGGEYRRENYRDVEKGSAVADKGISNQGLFVQNRIAMNKTTDALVGGRLDNHSIAGSRFTPRLGINHAFTDKTRVRLSYGQGFRSPSLTDLYFNNFGTVGNPDLKPERSQQYELGVNTQIGDDTLDIAIFTNSVIDQITWKSTATSPYDYSGTYENVSRARQRGIEVSWDHPLTRGMHLVMFYTYIDAMNLTDGTRLSGIPYNQLGATLTGKVKTWNLALTGRANSDRSFGTLKAAGYLVFDLTLTQQTDKPLNPYIIVRNLTNAHYDEMVNYPAEGRSIEAGARTTW